jgi:ribonucleotide reductase beta subunit family protein with ferritin-like domain
MKIKDNMKEQELAKHLIPIYTDKTIVDFADNQLKVFWLPEEIKVEKDIQDVLTNFTESEKHAVITTLKLFSLYETHAGDEYWGERFKKMFDGAEYHRMASVFSMFELAVHAPFYNKINELLYINTPEFYTSYVDNPILKDRIDHISEMISDEDDLISLGSFSMVEGVILYSNFAFLKHYQSQGKNKLLNVVRGLNFSVRDENLHAEASAYAFKQKAKNSTPEHLKVVEEKIRESARKIFEHEKKIISMLFEKGKIEGITAHQLENFVQSRINHCLRQLGFEKEYNVTYDPIASWFYKGINDYKFNDFFAGQGNQYHRNWDETAFSWKGQD